MNSVNWSDLMDVDLKVVIGMLVGWFLILLGIALQGL